MMRSAGLVAWYALLALLLVSCSDLVPKPPPQSTGHLRAPAPTAEPETIPPVVTTTPVLTPPVPAPAVERYTVVVNSVPARELLFALARDAHINVDVHDGIEGSVTLNAIDQTLEEILDRTARQVAMRYELRNGTLIVEPDTPYLRSYTVDYVNLARDTVKTVSVSTQINTTGGDVTGSNTSTSGAAGGNNSTTDVRSVSYQRFWQTLVANLAAIVGDVAPTQSSEGVLTSTGSVIANPETGIVSVRATRRQHLQVQAFLDQVMASAQREVLVEATIVEVELSDRYRAGINWAQLASDAGFSFQQSLLGGALSQAPFFLLNYKDTQTSEGSVDVTVRALSEFGDVRVLSSPKVMVLNNQTALLKVVDNQVYFTVDVQTTSTQGIVDRTFETTVHTVPVGFIMSVTPGIHADGSVILNVRPTVSRITDFVNDPNPELAKANVENPIPVIQTREMESLLRVQSGQIAVLGGLMQDRGTVDTSGVPLLQDIPRLGELFKSRDNRYSKTELVVFLRPIIVRSPSIQADLRDLGPFLEPSLDLNLPKGLPRPDARP